MTPGAAEGGAEPEWLDRAVVLAIHEEQIAQHGGAPGVRDAGLMDSALARPRNRHAYGEADPCVLAAALGHGLARNHPFVDGNKRTAYVAVEAFLALNGLDLVSSDAESTVAMLALASGEMAGEGFAAWLRDNTRPRGA